MSTHRNIPGTKVRAFSSGPVEPETPAPGAKKAAKPSAKKGPKKAAIKPASKPKPEKKPTGNAVAARIASAVKAKQKKEAKPKAQKPPKAPKAAKPPKPAPAAGEPSKRGRRALPEDEGRKVLAVRLLEDEIAWLNELRAPAGGAKISQGQFFAQHIRERAEAAKLPSYLAWKHEQQKKAADKAEAAEK